MGEFSLGAGSHIRCYKIRNGVGYACRLDTGVIEEHIVQGRIMGILVEKITVKAVSQFLLFYDQFFRRFRLDIQSA